MMVRTMLSEKLLIGVLLLGWRLIRFIGMLPFRRGQVFASTGVYDDSSRVRRSSSGSGLIWTTVLALLFVGVPLARSDEHFMAGVEHNISQLHGVLRAISSSDTLNQLLGAGTGLNFSR